jgi:hypothetical protein
MLKLSNLSRNNQAYSQWYKHTTVESIVQFSTTNGHIDHSDLRRESILYVGNGEKISLDMIQEVWQIILIHAQMHDEIWETMQWN